MECINCGQEIQNTRFCTYCGAEVNVQDPVVFNIPTTKKPVGAIKTLFLKYRIWIITALVVFFGIILYLFVFGDSLAGTKWVSEGNYTLVFTDEKKGYVTIGESESWLNRSEFTYYTDGDRLTMTNADGSIIRTYYELDDGKLILTEPGSGEKEIWHDSKRAFACDECGEICKGTSYGGTMELCEYCRKNLSE